MKNTSRVACGGPRFRTGGWYRWYRSGVRGTDRAVSEELRAGIAGKGRSRLQARTEVHWEIKAYRVEDYHRVVAELGQG